MTKQPTLGRLLMRAAPLLNVLVAALARCPGVDKLMSRKITMLTYNGRRSGRRYSIPVAYRRSGDDVIVNANMPEATTWWHNFVAGGAPLTLRLDGTDRVGHAAANRDGKGRVTVTVRLIN